MLVNPVLLYSPSHFPRISLANPFRLTVRQQPGEVEATEQVKASSSTKLSVSKMWNCHPEMGGLSRLAPALAFK